MPNKPEHYVWVWIDGKGNPKFVGWGKLTEQGTHPAKRVWAQRKKWDSELNRWLCKRKREPRRCKKVISGALTRKEASAMAVIYREKYQKKGHRLLHSRVVGSWDGGGHSRQVLDPNLKAYESVREAAVAEGVNASTITRWCQDPDKHWDYVS